MSAAKEVRRLVRDAEQQGWVARPVRSGWQLLAPDGVHIVTVHKTPSQRSIRNYIADMRKYGFKPKGR